MAKKRGTLRRVTRRVLYTTGERRGQWTGRTKAAYKFGGIGMIYRFKQMAFNVINGAVINLTNNNTADTLLGWYIVLADLPQVNSFQALFDQYRISKVSVSFMPQANNIANLVVTGATSGTSSGNAQSGAHIVTAIDYDNAGTPATMNAIREYDNAQEYEAYKPFTRTWRPHVAVPAYAGAVTTGYTNKGNVWIDCAAPTVQHYGLRIGLSKSLGTINNFWDVKTTYYLEFRNVT